eukprot:5280019-Amphidinium_carterae.1
MMPLATVLYRKRRGSAGVSYCVKVSHQPPPLFDVPEAAAHEVFSSAVDSATGVCLLAAPCNEAVEALVGKPQPLDEGSITVASIDVVETSVFGAV